MLEANPDYRPSTFPDTIDPAFAAYAAGMKGVKLPAVGRVELSIIEEELPELLAFEKGDFDYAVLGGSASKRLLQDGKLKPEYARAASATFATRCRHCSTRISTSTIPSSAATRRRRSRCAARSASGSTRRSSCASCRAATAFPRRNCCRRASTATTRRWRSTHRTIRPRHARCSTASATSIATATAIRELPDGSPLALTQNGTPDTQSRETGKLWITSMKAIGIRMRINSAPFAELLKQANAGQLQVFDLGYRSPSPPASRSSPTLWGKAPPDTNHSRFRNADYDAGYAQFLRTPPGPARNAVARRMSDVVVAYAPIVYQLVPGGQRVYCSHG